MSNYLDNLESVAAKDVAEIKRKDADYGGSWKKRGGCGAWMMACRKFDRIETQLQQPNFNWDVFKAIIEDTRPEGIIDDIRDLRRYLLLIEAEIQTYAIPTVQASK